MTLLYRYVYKILLVLYLWKILTDTVCYSTNLPSHCELAVRQGHIFLINTDCLEQLELNESFKPHLLPPGFQVTRRFAIIKIHFRQNKPF